MIDYQIDCPFEIGDTVYVAKDVYNEKQIECPFCKGNSVVDTGLTCWGYDEPLRMMSKFYEKKLILKCKNCNGTGVIKYKEAPVREYEQGVVMGIYRMHGNGWMNIEFAVEMFSTAHIDPVYGKYIRKVKDT